MKSIKIIDLLNMISKGEELPNKIKNSGFIWELDEEENIYVNDALGCFFEDYIDHKWYITEILNNEVEIIKEHNETTQEHKIAHLGHIAIAEFNETENSKRINYNTNMKLLEHKLNEIIDKINEMESK